MGDHPPTNPGGGKIRLQLPSRKWPRSCTAPQGGVTPDFEASFRRVIRGMRVTAAALDWRACALFGKPLPRPGRRFHSELLHGANACGCRARASRRLGRSAGTRARPAVIRSLHPPTATQISRSCPTSSQPRPYWPTSARPASGGIGPENTHPFQHGPWLFAQQRNDPDWERARGPLEASIDPALRSSCARDRQRALLPDLPLPDAPPLRPRGRGR